MTIEQLYEHYCTYPHVQTDSRKIKAGDMFFALKGPNFNGNRFARAALSAGASCVVVDEDPGFSDSRIYRFEDVLDTLQQLALYHRMQFKIPFLAITGSNGKTTTKELVHAVLSARYKTYTTRGNLNNHIGIPLTLLTIRKDAEMAVIEMGANHQQEIAGYCRYVRPSHGLITNCGKAHLEGFGGVEGVRKGKGELYDFLRASGGTAFVMWDYDYLREMSRGIGQIETYGTLEAGLTGKVLHSDPFLEIETDLDGPVKIRTRLVGDYNLPNVLAALAVGRYFKVPKAGMTAAIEAYTPDNNRSQMIEKGSNRIILDAYNANPSSMRVAITNMARQDHPQKRIFIGGMMELGDESLAEHAGIIELLQQHAWADIVLVGGDFANLPHPYRYFKDAAQAADWLKENPVREALILIKGSRSMQMEKLLEAF